jgi:hypothetical protein
MNIHRLRRIEAKHARKARQAAKAARLGFGDDSAEVVRRNADYFGLHGAGKARPATFGHSRGERLQADGVTPRALQDSTLTGRNRPSRKPHAVWFSGGKYAK